MQRTGKWSLVTAVQTAIKVGFLTISVFIMMAVLGEYILRLFTPSHNYLTPKLSYHKQLGYHVEPFHAGHDAWGFRNQEIPERVDTVTIGDSFTYGTSVRVMHGLLSLQTKLISPSIIWRLEAMVLRSINTYSKPMPFS